MRALAIAWNELKIWLRDGKGLLLTFLMPIVLTAILGMALSGVMSSGADSMPEMEIGLYDAEKSELSTILAERVLQHKDLKKYIHLKEYSSEKELRKSIQDGERDAGIIIPAGYSKKLTNGQSVQITVLRHPEKSTSGQIVESLVAAYTDRVTAIADATQVVANDLLAKPGGQASLQSFVQQLEQLGDDSGDSRNDFVREQSVGKKSVSSFQYYAAAMAVMFLLFNSVNGAKSILGEKRMGTLSRLLTTPTQKSSILVGKFLGTLLFSVFQISFFMLATFLIFQVSWGENILQSVTIAFVYAFAVAGIAMMLASIVKTEESADQLAGFGVQIFSMLGGSMVPLFVFPEVMRNIALFTPNYWALDGFLDVMSGVSWSDLFLTFGVLLAIGLSTLSIGIWRLQAR